MMMIMICFCGRVDRQKAFSFISSWDHRQRSSPLRISNTSWAGFEPAQNLSSGIVEWSCAVVITTMYSFNFQIRPIPTKNQNLSSENSLLLSGSGFIFKLDFKVLVKDIGISIGINPASFCTNLFLYIFESKYIKQLI